MEAARLTSALELFGLGASLLDAMSDLARESRHSSQGAACLKGAQNAKGSLRADLFRFASASRH
jgi:hypothetical protein